MKSRIVAAPQIILSYNLSDQQTEKLNLIAKKLNVSHKPVPLDSANEKIGCLCGFKGFEKTGVPCEAPPMEQCLIFSGIQRKNIEALLKELKSAQLIIPLKAMVTPSNQRWTLTALITELKKEHKLMTERK